MCSYNLSITATNQKKWVKIMYKVKEKKCQENICIWKIHGIKTLSSPHTVLFCI